MENKLMADGNRRTKEVSQHMQIELANIAKPDPERPGQKKLEAQDVVDVARHPGSVLHGFFTWDDTEAAEKWRLNEARALITSFKIQIENREIKVKQFTSLEMDRVKGGGYRFMEDVLATDALRQHLLESAVRELESVQRRYTQLEELAAVWGAIEEAAAAQQSAPQAELPIGKTPDGTQEESIAPTQPTTRKRR